MFTNQLFQSYNKRNNIEAKKSMENQNQIQNKNYRKFVSFI